MYLAHAHAAMTTWGRAKEEMIRADIPDMHSGASLPSRNLVLEATRGVTVALVSPHEWKRRQPGLAA